MSAVAPGSASRLMAAPMVVGSCAPRRLWWVQRAPRQNGLAIDVQEGKLEISPLRGPMALHYVRQRVGGSWMGQRFTLVLAAVVAAMAAVVAVAFPVVGAGAAGGNPVSVTPLSGFDAQLTRAPYVTDLTQTSADVTWATTVSTPGTLKWGTGSNCTATTVAVPSSLPALVNGPSPTSATARDFTVGSLTEYQSTVTISGLSPNTTYCYRIFLGTTDLLGSSQTFTTLAAAGASSSVSFDVVGDLGETYYTTAGAPFPGAVANYNPDQAAIDKLIGASGAQFLLTAGDVAYSGGTQTDYGDLQKTGPEVSDMFGPSYWPQTGGLPTFGSVGNHGQNVDSLRNWPESNTTASSGGVYAYDSYPGGVDGTTASSAPDEWYAFSTGNVRIYVLDAGWANGDVGTADIYKVDYDNHWAPGSPEYQWLANDLASHPGGVKMAVFHFPLRSDNSTESSDVYLQNSSANPNASTSLEALLAANGVSIAFNGHAHTYQRINPRVPGEITNYVTGGGGGVLEPVDGGCSSLFGSADVYALGWSPTSNSGSNCGAGSSTPTSAAQVYNFLEVTVTGSTIVVNGVNAEGKSFDTQKYTAAGNSSTPSTPGLVTAAATSSTSIQVSWSPSTETGGTITGYEVLRKGPGSTYSPVATLPGTSTSYVDPSVQPGIRFTYEVVASDNKSLSSSPGISNSVATPTIPGSVTAAATSGTSVQLNWTTSTEAGGSIQSYEIGRNGATINTVPASTSYTDTTAQPGMTYTYSVTAIDGIGAPSTPAGSNPVTTPGQAPVASTGGCMNHLPAGQVVGSAALSNGAGYYMVDSQGDVAAFGAATCYGAMTGTPLNRPIVGMAVDPATGGYWLVASDGGIFSFNAPFFGSTGAIRLNRPIVGMTSTPGGAGYWMVASDGGIFSFGNAPFFGSTGNLVLNRPVVGMGLDPATGGYWLVASDGGIFSFNAPFFGSTGAIRLNQPVVGMITSPDGGGYRLIASDGGVFCFNEPFLGSTGNIVLNRPVIGGLGNAATGGYWLTASDGGVFSFNAPFLGSAA